MEEIKRRAAARHRAEAVLADRTDELKEVLLPAIRAKEISENAAAELVGVNRMTIRAWLGKSTGKPTPKGRPEADRG